MAVDQGCLALEAILPLIWELRFNEEVNWEKIINPCSRMVQDYHHIYRMIH
jgi:hypothetical protein